MEPKNNGKTIAIISYLTVFGTIVAFIMNNGKRNYFVSFHIRQMLGLNLLTLATHYIISPYLGSIAGWIFTAITFALWFIGFIGALNGEEKRVPLLGDQFQNWFKNI